MLQPSKAREMVRLAVVPAHTVPVGILKGSLTLTGLHVDRDIFRHLVVIVIRRNQNSHCSAVLKESHFNGNIECQYNIFISTSMLYQYVGFVQVTLDSLYR